MQNKTIEDEVTEFCTKMWRTSGARFNAQRRMRYRNTMSVFTISLLSLYLIAIAVSQKIYFLGDVCPDLDKNLTFISIVGAVFIIIISLIEWASDFSLKSDRLFENANTIKDNRLDLEQSLSKGLSSVELCAKLELASNHYKSLTNGNNPNHEPIDDLFFRAQNKSEPSKPFSLTRCERGFAYIRWYFACYGLYIIALTSPLLILLILA
ncbi:MAG: SLATT domain-containing protein [Methylotenera sp.]|nr:SLATT domain-containing protein [Methylotenera sp.]